MNAQEININKKDNHQSERDELLIKHLEKLNVYDLERLKTCFEYEYRYNIDNRDSTENILIHIDELIKQKTNQ